MLRGFLLTIDDLGSVLSFPQEPETFCEEAQKYFDK